MTKAPQKSQPITVATILESGERLFESQGLFYGHGTTNAWDEAVYLLTFVLDLPPDADRSVLSKVLTAQQQSDVEALFQRRVNERIPAPYLTGTAWFCGLAFRVDQRVIIPRSPLAELTTMVFSLGARSDLTVFSIYAQAVAALVLPVLMHLNRRRWY